MSSMWSVPAYLPYVHPPLTAAAIANAESQLGVTLPAAFLDLLREQNGGYLRCTFPKSVHQCVWGIGERYPSIVDQRHWLDLADEEQPPGAHLLVPFDGDGHWYLCLDYREVGPQGEPSVKFIDVEMGGDEMAAPNFATFLTLLKHEFANPTWGLSGIPMDEAVERLSDLLSARFEPGRDFDNGYMVRGATLSEKLAHARVWVSPNRVPRAFARKGQKWSREAAALLTGEGLQIPDHPDVATIVACTPAALTHVEPACAALGAIKISAGRTTPAGV